MFSYADNQPEDYPTVQGARKFAELVQEKTSGRIRINVFAGGEMGNENEVVEQLQYGGIDFARASVMMLTDIKPKFNVLQLPYLYRDETHMWKVLDGEIGEEFKTELKGSGLVALSWYDAGARHFYNSSGPIERMEDMKKNAHSRCQFRHDVGYGGGFGSQGSANALFRSICGSGDQKH